MARLCRYVKYKQFGDHDFEITSKISPIYNNSVDRSRKEDPTIHSARVARQRARKSLDDVLRCNEWKFFITLTFGIEGREDDQIARDTFAKWRRWIKKTYPYMYYVAVPEYHTAGCLHFHIVVGGVTAEELELEDSGRVLHYGKAWKKEDFEARGFEVDPETGEGLPIYNMPNWKYGFSTCTEVRSSIAVSRYIGKYISKVNIDPRFYNKKHFYTSHNIKRPNVQSEDYPIEVTLTVDRKLSEYGADRIYSDLKLLCFEKYKVPPSKEEIIRMRLQGLIPMQKHELPFDIT